MEEFEERWQKIQEQKEIESKEKIAKLEAELPKERVFEIMERENRLKKFSEDRKFWGELAEDVRELEAINSIPPVKTQGAPMAETNLEPVLPKIQTWEQFIREPIDWLG